MDGMSDIRNEIEQRLGVFARPSAKETFANDTDSFLTIKGVRYRIAGTRKDSKGNLVYDLHGTSKTAHPVIYTLVKFLDDHRWVLWGAQGQEVARGKMEASRPGAKAAFGVWGDAPDKYRAAIDFIQNQRSPSSAAMNDLKKAIKAAQAEAKKVRDPNLKRTYEDDAGSLQNVLEYAQRGDRSTLLRAAYNLDTAVRDDIPVEMFIWAGADVNWQHRNAKSLLDTVSALVARSKHGKQAIERASERVKSSRPGAKATAAKPDDKTECADCETEQDKAGLKLMEKADKAVSDKIRTLIKEGKPQDQAVAIALDMKRRGEL